MDFVSKTFGKLMQRSIDRHMGAGLIQEENTPEGERYYTEGFPELIRKAGAEACVLLKNDGMLPLKKDEETAVFGRCQLDWFYVGYGSGGDVHPAWRVNLMEGLKNAGQRYNRTLADTYAAWCAENPVDQGWWGHWPFSYPEMELDETLVRDAAKTAQTALVVIGRAAGEDRENMLEKGSYYLTEDERTMLDLVTEHFKRVAVLMNVGSIMDMAWTEDYGARISAVLYVWQGGMESGNAAADILCGKTSPSGRLSDTIARYYVDYPSSKNFGGKDYNNYAEGIFVGYRHFDRFAPKSVLFPFGFGLSYTSFKTVAEDFAHQSGTLTVTAKVTNTGTMPGKEVVQLWCYAPVGALDKPKRVLCAFAKTNELYPGDSETVTLRCTDQDFASYDESRHAFILEAGQYRFTVGEQELGSFRVPEDRIVRSCRPLKLMSDRLRQVILTELPAPVRAAPARGTLDDVAAGKLSLEAFAAGLSPEELEALSRGEGMMNVPLGVPGNAGGFGGVTEGLREKGIDELITADGPAGLRLQRFTCLMPIGTALACTWNTELVEALHQKLGEEMTHYGVDVQLGPGMNLHRNPLCGRNFEYYSEDPLLTGKIAAAAVRGVQSRGHASCPKHFACNNQETRRNQNDSRLSERALREIYLRGFEICVREAKPLTIMTSYNKVNGVWAHYSYELATTVLRGDWGFEGVVITDWWMQHASSPEFPALRDNAYRVRAGVDVLMPGDWKKMAKYYRSDGTLLETLGQSEGITLAELQRTAMRVLRLVLRLKKGCAPEAACQDREIG